MKITLLSAALIAAAATAAGQSSPPTKDSDLPGLTTPVTVEQGKFVLGLQATSFGGSDNLTRTGAFLKYGISGNWEVRIAGAFSSFTSSSVPGGAGSVAYGGSDGNIVFKYGYPGAIDTSVEVGVGYINTPAQEERSVGLLGASAGYSLFKQLRVYVNPKFVGLQDNYLLGVTVGAVVDIAHKISLYGDWTPLFNGDNSVSELTGNTSREQLYAVGIRLVDILPRISLDLAYTNMIGDTYGFSLTPSFGNTGGGYIGLNYHF